MEPLPKRPRSEFGGPGPLQHPQDWGGFQLVGGGGGDLECRRFNTPEGCSYGPTCRFRHVPADGRDVGPQSFSSAGKPKPCMKFFSTSGCQFGETCHFLHYVPGGLSSLGLAPVVSLSAAPASALQKKPPVPVGDPSVAVNGYKTKLCNRFNTAEGCRFGDRCHFAHGERDMRPPNNTSRVNNIRPMANGGPVGTAPPGLSNGGSHFPNPTVHPALPPGNAHFPNPTGHPALLPGNVSSFPIQGYAGPNQAGFPGNNAGYLGPSGYPPPPANVSSFTRQVFAEPTQHGVPANNISSVTYPAGSVNENVPVY